MIRVRNIVEGAVGFFPSRNKAEQSGLALDRLQKRAAEERVTVTEAIYRTAAERLAGMLMYAALVLSCILAVILLTQRNVAEMLLVPLAATPAMTAMVLLLIRKHLARKAPVGRPGPKKSLHWIVLGFFAILAFSVFCAANYPANEAVVVQQLILEAK